MEFGTLHIYSAEKGFGFILHHQLKEFYTFRAYDCLDFVQTGDKVSFTKNDSKEATFIRHLAETEQ